jgi:outer membrane receptor protein involved in Fe transport
LTDSLSLTGGLRYTHENKTLGATITSNTPGCAAALALHGLALATLPAMARGLICIPNLDPRYDGFYETERDGGDWSGTAALSNRFSDSWDAYFSYSRGYKAGGFQFDRSGMDPLAPSLTQLMFEEETADSFEGGIKSAAPDGTWRLNSTVFHTTFNNYQFSWFTGVNRYTKNVPQLTSKGVELEAGYRPGALEISLSGIYQDVQFGDSGFPPTAVQVQGTTPPVAPRWILAGAVGYQRPFEGLGITGFGNVDVRWQSRAYVGASADPARQDFYQDAYAVVGARIGAQTLNGNYKIEVWARNLFNQRAWSILNNTTLQPGFGGMPGSISGFVIDPRSFGVTLTGAW